MSTPDNNDNRQEISAESYGMFLSNLTSKMVTWYEETQKLDTLRRKNPDEVKQATVDVLRESIEKAFNETVNAYVDFRLLEASNPSYAHCTDFGICAHLPKSVGFDQMNPGHGNNNNKIFLSLMDECKRSGLTNLIRRIAHQEGGSSTAVERINQLVHLDQNQMRDGYIELLGSAPKVNWVKKRDQ